MNPARLQRDLREFDPEPEALRVVVRQATDLADSGRFEEDAGYLLGPGVVVRNLRDAPHEGLVERWNWWIGSLVVAYGEEYARFEVRRYGGDSEGGG